MSLLRYSKLHRRNSLYAPKKTYHSFLNKCSNILPKLDELPSETEDQSKKNDSCNIKSCCSAKCYNGEPLIDNDMPRALTFSSFKDILNGEFNITSLPPLPSPEDSTFDQIFKNKVKLCNFIFNFMQPHIQLKGKREKTIALNEINTLLSKITDVSLLTDQNKDLLYNMVKRNIFEQDPFKLPNKNCSLTLKLNYVECSWEHISIAFKILNQFILLFPEKIEFKLIKESIRLMNIPDPNIRENLVKFLTEYTKVHRNRFNDIWKQLKCALTNAKYNIYTSYCIEPIVSFMSNQLLSKSSSFCTNYLLKILYDHLLPLFDHNDLSIYFNKLSTLITQIIENNYEDKLKVIQYLLKHFPIQCSQKQPLFVSMLISITNTMNSDQLNPLANKIFSFIAMAINLPNSKLAESALLFLLKPNLKPIIFNNYENAMDILYEPLKSASSNYWEKSIQDQSSVALSTLINAKFEFKQNIALSEFVSNTELSTISESKKLEDPDLAKTWGSLARAAAKRDRTIDLTKSLFSIQKEFKKEEKNLSLQVPNKSVQVLNCIKDSSAQLLKNRCNSVANYRLSSTNFTNFN